MIYTKHDFEKGKKIIPLDKFYRPMDLSIEVKNTDKILELEISDVFTEQYLPYERAIPDNKMSEYRMVLEQAYKTFRNKGVKNLIIDTLGESEPCWIKQDKYEFRAEAIASLIELEKEVLFSGDIPFVFVLNLFIGYISEFSVEELLFTFSELLESSKFKNKEQIIEAIKELL